MQWQHNPGPSVLGIGFGLLKQGGYLIHTTQEDKEITSLGTGILRKRSIVKQYYNVFHFKQIHVQITKSLM